MELKDVILSTLAEMEETPSNNVSGFEVKETITSTSELTESASEVKEPTKNVNSANPENELMFLNSMRERLLVLFEGFQAPNNANIEAKVDLTLNFLEYVLATIDTRLENLEKGNKK